MDATERLMTAAQEATLKSLAQAAYELEAFKPNRTRTEADKRIAMLTANSNCLTGHRIHSETGAAGELAAKIPGGGVTMASSAP